MPIPYKTTRYGCQHRCGTRRRSTAKKAEMHEAICWKNPELKTCQTCINEIYDTEEYVIETNEEQGEVWGFRPVRSCHDETAAIMITQEYPTLLNEKNDHIKPIVNCPFWEPKNEN